MLLMYLTSFSLLSQFQTTFTSFLTTGLLIGRGRKSQISQDFWDKFAKKSADFTGVFGANFTKKQSVKNGRFCGYFQGKFR